MSAFKMTHFSCTRAISRCVPELRIVYSRVMKERDGSGEAPNLVLMNNSSWNRVAYVLFRIFSCGETLMSGNGTHHVITGTGFIGQQHGPCLLLRCHHVKPHRVFYIHRDVIQPIMTGRIDQTLDSLQADTP